MPSRLHCLLNRKRRSRLGVEPGGCAAGDQASGEGEGLETLRPSRDAYVLDDDIHAALRGDFPDFGRDVLAVVIDDVIGAEFARFRELLFAAGGRDDAALEELRDLDGGCPTPLEAARTSTSSPGCSCARGP